MAATIASRLMLSTGVLLLAGVASLFTWRYLRADAEAQVYRDRLERMTADYETLRTTYNDAVRRTAVTELVVKDRKLSVRVRNAAGVVKDVATPLDPSREIYVDYVVLDNRLLIRRVFDHRTAPDQGVLIEPELGDVDWDAPGIAHGKAVYRVLAEGRWVITATANGALGLTRAPDHQPADLLPAPEIKDFAKIDEEAREQVRRLGLLDVLRRVIGW
ncbi:MAG: hypothetical protein FJ255_01490 [Phycisphaerae bacterium]|nr:hypothetical protein [Phycisphaerae bacterium]